jgi:Tol biopolymer transport system component
MRMTRPFRTLAHFGALMLPLLAVACQDQPTDPIGQTDAAYAKGGPNAPPTNEGRIYFSSQMTGNGEIYSINPDGSELRRLTYTAEQEKYPVVSPDGKKVAYLKGDDLAGKTNLWIMNADGTRQQLRYTVPADIYNIYAPTWTPDGRSITFSYIENAPPNARRIASINAKNGSLTVHAVEGMYPSWSPDGKYLSFSRRVGAYDQLFTSRADGSDETQYTVGFEYCCGVPTWSPYGDRVLFIASPNINGPYWMYAANVGGQTPFTLLTSAMSVGNGAWSRDAAKIAFSSGGDLYVSLANGSGATLILPGAQFFEGISWSR